MSLYYHFIAAAIIVAQYLKTTKILIAWQGFVFVSIIDVRCILIVYCHNYHAS